MLDQNDQPTQPSNPAFSPGPASPTWHTIVTAKTSLWWNRLQQFWRNGGAGAKIALSAAALTLMVGCGAGSILLFQHVTAKPDGYLSTDPTAVAFIQFNEDANNHLTGSWQVVEVNSDQKITSEDTGFTGSINGSRVSLTFSALGFSTTITGTLNGDTLTLQAPDSTTGYIATAVFQAANIQQYNAAVALLRQHVAATITQAALDQAVTNANRQLSQDLSTLSSDVQTLATSSDFSRALSVYADQLNLMQQDYQLMQRDAQLGCGVSASAVAADFSALQADDNAFQADQGVRQQASSQVQSDLKALSSDWQTLKAAISADRSGHISAQFTQGDVDTATTSAQEQIKTFDKALSDAQSAAAAYVKEAAQINTDAQNLANSLHC